MSWLLSWGHVSQRTRAFISVSYVLSLPFPPFPFPSFDDPSFTRLAFLCRTFCHPLWISFLSLSLPTALKGPLVCLTTLWLPDLCIQCVITGPTLSCKSLFDWLTAQEDIAIPCALSSVFIYVHFMCSFLTSSFSFSSPFSNCYFFVLSHLLALSFFSLPSSADYFLSSSLFWLLPQPSSVSLQHLCPLPL